MERRNWSLEALNKLKYINSLDDEYRAKSLSLWVGNYLIEDYMNKLYLSSDQLQEFLELFYQNIAFLKKHKKFIHKELNENNKIKKFFQ